MKNMYRVTADIDLEAIYHNISNTRKLMKSCTKLLAVVKANGYGHGAIQIAKILDELVDAFGVAIIEEAIELREAGVTKPILILGYTPPEYYHEVLQYQITQTVYTYEMARLLGKLATNQGKCAKVHLAVDTGMGRIGFTPDENGIEEVKQIAGIEGIEIEGCFTHFAKADESNPDATRIQIQKYDAFVKRLKEEGIPIAIKHVCNSAGIMMFPEVQYDMVRSGITTYGLYPSEEVDKKKLPLEPAMSLHTRVAFVKTVDKGTAISYGGTYIAPNTRKIATIPVGYADGYYRELSNKGRVLIHGMSAPIVGRVCMDQFMVDVTDIPQVQEGDVVTLLGRDGEEEITAEEISAAAHSFNYEFVCDISHRVPRIFRYGGMKIETK